MERRVLLVGSAPRLLIVSLLVALAGPVAAPEPGRAAVALLVSPALVEVQAKPGSEASQPIRVGNGGDEAVEITTSVESYRDQTGERSAVEWLKAEPERFELRPGEQREVRVEIAVPDGLESGGRYAVVSFSGGGGKIEGSGTGVTGKVGVAFFFTVDGKGKLERRVELTRFAPTLEPDGRIGFLALLHNEGNLHVRPAGVVGVTDADGQPFASLELAGGATLLPGGDVLLPAQGSLPLDADARYRAEVVVDYGAQDPATTAVEFSPRAALAIASTAVCEQLDRGPRLTVELQNSGELALLPVAALEVRHADGSSLGIVAPSTPVALWPGERRAIALDFPERLPSGEYILAARVEYAAPLSDGRTVLPPVEQESPFRIGGLDDGAAPLCED